MLKTRVLTALVLIVMFIPALFMLPQLWWAGLMMALTLICLQEWAGFIKLGGRQTQAYLLVCGVSGVFLLAWLSQMGFHGFFYHTMRILMVAVVFWCLVVPVSLYFNYFPKSPLLGLLIGWAIMMTLWLSLVIAQTLNPNLLLVVISTIWLADSAAYFAGKNFGRHKLAPAISPGKTWEGVLGALLAVSVYASLLKAFHAVSTWWILPCLWVITVVGIYGDLFESYFKRRAQLKDSGQILPGHGGLLDRIDGVIPALPVGLCLVFWFLYLKQSYSF